MFGHAVMQYFVHEYMMHMYVCEKCKFTLFIDFPSYIHYSSQGVLQVILHSLEQNYFKEQIKLSPGTAVQFQLQLSFIAYYKKYLRYITRSGVI
jgi:hypothetical protein